MHKYFIKTPWWARAFFSSYVWRIPSNEKKVYLTFDDGPHPTITPWVLNELRKFGAKATFFCIGKNVVAYRDIYEQIIMEGHAVGNHTFHHLNGWRTDKEDYLADVFMAADIIGTKLFRPPYGKIKLGQAKRLMRNDGYGEGFKVIMWDVLSADFDTTVSPELCLQNVLKNVSPGSIIVFHDSEKAFPNLGKALPKVLSTLKNEGYEFEEILMERL